MLQRIRFAACVLLVAASLDATKIKKKSTVGGRKCPEGALKCKNGECIDSYRYCILLDRCQDETQFPDFICPDVTCNTGYVKCPGKSRCISSGLFCDGYNQCGDWTDEPADCSERSCAPGEFRCDNGQCLNRTALCMSTHYHGCTDSTDMKDVCRDAACPTGYFKCVSDGKCIANSYLCSGYSECSDGSDETPQTCGDVACPMGYFKCVSDGKCIANWYLCSDFADCSDGSDESPQICGIGGSSQ